MKPIVACSSPPVADTIAGGPGGDGAGGLEPTTTAPVMSSCASQTNVYLPGASNRHVPAQPGDVTTAGSGGTDPAFAPAVWVHDAGWAPPKTTLCALPPVA